MPVHARRAAALGRPNQVFSPALRRRSKPRPGDLHRRAVAPAEADRFRGLAEAADDLTDGMTWIPSSLLDPEFDGMDGDPLEELRILASSVRDEGF